VEVASGWSWRPPILGRRRDWFDYWGCGEIKPGREPKETALQKMFPKVLNIYKEILNFQNRIRKGTQRIRTKKNICLTFGYILKMLDDIVHK